MSATNLAPELEQWTLEHPAVDVQLVLVPEGTRRPERLNEGLHCATGEYVVCLDEQVRLSRGWLANMLAIAALDTRIALVGPRLTHGNKSQGGVVIPTGQTFEAFADAWFVQNAGKLTPVPALSSSCLLISRSFLNDVGGIDGQFIGEKAAEEDLGLRATRAGMRAFVAEDVLVANAPAPVDELLGDAVRRFDDHVFTAKHGRPIRVERDVWELALGRKWVTENDYIHPSLVARMQHATTPLAMVGDAASRVLMIPDWDEPAWQTLFVEAVIAVGGAENASLVVRVEPPEPATVERAHRVLTELLAQVEQRGQIAGDVVLETSELAPSQRGTLYAAVSAYLPCPGRLATTHLLEASAAGVPILGESEANEADTEPARVLVSAK